MTKKVFETTAAALLAVILPGNLGAHETEQELDAPGFRPPSDLSAAFVQGITEAKIAVFPTIMRTFEDTSYFTASQQSAVDFLRKSKLGDPQAVDRRFDMKDVEGKSQWEMFQSGMQTIGRQLDKYDGDADYVLVLELLVPVRSGSMAVFGIHCYVLDRNGANAFSFLLNSHHKAFNAANLRTSDVTAPGKERLVRASTNVALTALREQVALAKKAASNGTE